jgi:hypothetical protein
LKKADKLGTGLSSWEEERAHEEKVRKQAGHVDTGSGYTTFKKKDPAEDAAERKMIKQVEARIRPDKQEYFLPIKTFQGWKFDYIFTTRPERGTGYFWDGMDSVKKIRGELKEEPPTSKAHEEESEATTDEVEKPPKKKKRKKNAGPTIVTDPNNPMEQVAALIQKRNQMLGGQDPSLPSGWEAARDQSSGKTYYFQRATGERSWEKPQASEKTADKAEDAEKLPDGWKSAADKATGKTYYYHTTGETIWEKPSA